MSRFFVGQRVRILWSQNWPELAGQEGVIVGQISPRPCDDPTAEWMVAPACWGTPEAPYRSKRGHSRFGPCSSQLEPILPEGHQPARWEDCAWQPDHLRERVA